MRGRGLDYAARLRLLLALALLLLGTAFLFHGCAHGGAGGVVMACAEKLTPELEAGAAAALAGADYETAIARSFANVAACLTMAAVEAAIDNARTIKLSGRGGAELQAAIELHGNAWVAAHRRT